MEFPQPISELVRRRYSCRRYSGEPLTDAQRERLEASIADLPAGPFGSRARFLLAAASEADRGDLRGLSTYGLIRGIPAFLIGAIGQAERGLEDFGYQMEMLVLFATGLGLGTCWVGGNFSRSGFTRKISTRTNESVPAVVPLGEPAGPRETVMDPMGKLAHGLERLTWEQLFFEGAFGRPLTPQTAGVYAGVLEMVRKAPSASNKQPWRVVKQDGAVHLYLRRTPGYRDNFGARLLGAADMQRIDIGIAMCHLDLAAKEAGLNGGWVSADPGLELPDPQTEYVASYR